MASFRLFPVIILAGIILSSICVVKGKNGFISVDCGLATGSNYTTLMGSYALDSGYINSGVNKQIDSSYSNTAPKIYQTLRAFPDNNRNCYEFGGVTLAGKYLIRAFFMYGNYDGLNMLPQFDLYVGVDFWETVTFDSEKQAHWTEIQVQAQSSSLYVCLVRTGNSVPFISGIELRPISQLFTPANNSLSLVTYMRINVGCRTEVRYPDDKYDRIWTPDYSSYGTPFNTSSEISSNDVSGLAFAMPSIVMQSAIYAKPGPIVITWPGVNETSFYVTIHFAELLLIPSNNTRQLDINFVDNHFFGPFFPPYQKSFSVYSIQPFKSEQYKLTISHTANSNYVPFVNAFQVYRILYLSVSKTDNLDLAAINAVKNYYSIKKNWVGDPCLPQNYPWDGLTCSYTTSTSRIISLDLSNGNLTGTISASFAQLSALQSLNLSHNTLEGSTSVLDGLSNLVNLDISCTNLANSLSSGLQTRVNSGLLKLSTGCSSGGISGFLLCIKSCFDARREIDIGIRLL